MHASSRWRPPILAALSFAACATSAGRPAVQAVQAAPTPPAASGAPRPPAAAADADLVPGIDIGRLGDFERKVFFRVIEKEASACGKGHSLLFSLKHDRACRKSFYAVRYVAKLVDVGYTDSEIAEQLEKRFRHARRSNIDVAQAPLKGKPDAPVALVEFVDYECPHCKHTQELLRQALDEYPDRVKLYFKHFPLGSKTNARLAAEAAVAAHQQRRFWPYNDRLWDAADEPTPAMLEKIAKQVGLNVARWRRDLQSDEAKARVARDKADGAELGINATPTLFINGRQYADRFDIQSLKDWIDEELDAKAR
jgi:protein-disulfide isomerase